MELVHGTNQASKSVLENVLIRMPENVITNILDRLPIQDAVRTGILSRKWRYKWTLLTKLVFDDKFFDYLSREEDYDWRVIISRLVIHLEGPITKFILYKLDDTELDVEDINHWIMFLSRKGIQEFTLLNLHKTPLKLPTHIFSCLELKHLNLRNCSFHSPTSFRGFPNLLSLSLYQATEMGNCAEILTNCPLLEILKFMYFEPIRKVKLVEIAKLINLKVLYLPLVLLDNVAITSSAIFQLVGSLPQLEKLSLNFRGCEFLGKAGVRICVCNAFPRLKTLTLQSIDLSSSSMLSCVLEMIWGSPDMQTLNISAAYTEVGIPPPAFCFPEVDNNTKLQLESVVFTYFRGSDNEVYLIKSLLACSPLLHHMTIYAESSQVFGGDNRKLFASKLLELNRASPIAKVKLSYF